MITHRKLAAILSADAAGYSRLMADDEAATLRSLNDARGLFRERIEVHLGRLIDTAGDSVLAEFPSAVEAVDCADEIQHELAKHNSQLAEHRRMHFRIGINLGDVIEQEDGTIYGDGVNVAARLQQLAEPGGICVSGTAFDHVEGKLPLQFKFIGEQQVKNIAKPVRTYRVLIGTDAGKSRPTGASKRRRIGIGAAVCIVIAAALGVAWKAHKLESDQPPPSVSQKPRLAVLPLDNFSAHSEDEYFSDGMTEELISRLSRVAGLDVIARTSVMQYKGKKKSITDIGRELNVNNILEGSVRKAGDKVRITVQLIDVANQGHLWSADYDHDLKDILATQSDISEKVAKALHVKLVVAGTDSGQGHSGSNPKTYALYLKGRYYAGKLTPDGLKKSVEYFEQALALASDDANVWSAVARSYSLIGWFRYAPPNEAFSKGKVAAERALSLDATLSEAQLALGMVRFLFDWDWPGAEQAFQRAIELNPGNADAHLYYGVLHKVLGRNDRAVTEIRRANELDPLNLMASAELGWVAFFGGRLDEAAQACRRTLEMDPNYLFALHCLQFALTVKKDPEAIAVAKKFLELTSGDSYVLSILGWTYGVLGDRKEAQRILRQLEELSQTTPVPPPAMLYVNLGLGNLDATFEYLEKSYGERWNDVVFIKSPPHYDVLRSDPRFAVLLEKMRLAK
jgi:adenylate cyclase